MPLKARPRLASLITIGVGATVLLTVCSVLLLVNQSTRQYARGMAEQRLQQIAWQMSDSLDRVVAKAAGDVKLLAELAQASDTRDPLPTRRMLNQLQTSFPDYAWIGLAEPDGRVFAATQGMLEGHDVSARPWFQGGRRQLFAGDYHPAVLLQNKLPQRADPWRFIDLAAPVQRPDGSPRGVIGVHLSWSWARELAHSLLAPSDRQYAVDILVVRDDGTILVGPSGTEEQKYDSASLRAARGGASGALRERGADGADYLTGYARTGKAGDPATLQWAVLVRQPEKVALAEASALERRILWLGGLLGLVLAVAAAVLARRLASPLNRLSEAVEQRGREQQDGGRSAGPAIPLSDSFHEIQLLSHTLAEMVGREGRHADALLAMNQQLETTVGLRTREIADKAAALQQALFQEQQMLLELSANAAELRAILNKAHDAFIALDLDGMVVEWNEQAERLLGWPRADALGGKLAEMIMPPALRHAYRQDMQAFRDGADPVVLNRRVETTVRHRDGSDIAVEASLAYVPRSSGPLFIAFLHNISERKLLFASLESMALRDPLTRLPNRRALMQALPEALQRGRRLLKPVALFFLDLDGFKQVNDRHGHGHDEGDEVLRIVAQRITASVRSTDTVARLAGDEFVVILEMMDSAESAVASADKLLLQLQAPYQLHTTIATLGASIGIALHLPQDEADVEQLLSRADKAMYAAKNGGKNRIVLAA